MTLLAHTVQINLCKGADSNKGILGGPFYSNSAQFVSQDFQPDKNGELPNTRLQSSQI